LIMADRDHKPEYRSTKTFTDNHPYASRTDSPGGGRALERKPRVADITRRLAHNIRLLRTARGWSQEVLAELAGLDRSYVGAIERAEHNVSLASVEKFAKAFDITVAELIAQRDIL
jgi:ribosome-binding protein aMBF1 (putative translation factor)